MGFLSDLFGFGNRRNDEQDAAIAGLDARLRDVEARPSGGVDQSILERLSVLETRTVVDEAARHDTAELYGRLAVVEATLSTLQTAGVPDATARSDAAAAMSVADGAATTSATALSKAAEAIQTAEATASAFTPVSDAVTGLHARVEAAEAATLDMNTRLQAVEQEIEDVRNMASGTPPGGGGDDGGGGITLPEIRP